MFISLKPLAERGDLTDPARDRPPAPEVRAHPGHRSVHVRRRRTSASARRQGRSQYQFTLWSSDLDELLRLGAEGRRALKTVPGLVDVSTDREQGGLQANISIDRARRRRGSACASQDIDTALNNAFAQRQISTIYTQRNQYRVILEVDPRYQRDPERPVAHLRARPRRRAGAAEQP